jgi:CrcB protein
MRELVAISAGGALGALSRYGVSELVPHGAGEWPWATWFANVSGSLLIGVLMAVITEVWPRQRLVRPFLGVGVLGGYTTFSTAMVEVQQLVADGAPRTALLYLGGTALTALVAVAVGWTAAGAAIRLARRKGRST